MAGRGNPGYGKMEIVRANIDKFSPKFWELMGIYADSRDVEKEKIFLTEFNKIQIKTIPQIVAGDSDNPIPIINIPYVSGNNSDTENKESEETA